MVAASPTVVELHAPRRPHRLKGQAVRVLLRLDRSDLPRDSAQDAIPRSTARR
jgi:hypothetical protein